MRLYTPLVALSAATSLATAELTTTTQRWIVIGTNGELLDVDPTPYIPANRLERKRREDEARQAAEALKRLEKTAAMSLKSSAVDIAVGSTISERFFDDDEDSAPEGETSATDEQFMWSDTFIPDIETLMLESNTAAAHDVWLDEREASSTDAPFDRLLESNASSSGAASVWTDWARLLEDDTAFPTVQSSVVFAELSCLFVLFIGYLVLSIPLWPSFSRGQKFCLLLAFAAAFVYQIVALCWYFGGLSPDITLSISSLITRTISLGMVPITTTSFMGRARLAVEEKNNQKELPVETTPVYPPSRHRRAKAKAAAAAAAAAAASASATTTASAPAEKA